jgi:hypothetical protein
MPGQPRIEPPRFKIGQSVQITNDIQAPHAGEVGVIISVQYSQESRTLDKYIVHFASGDHQTLHDIHLKIPGQKS